MGFIASPFLGDARALFLHLLETSSQPSNTVGAQEELLNDGQALFIPKTGFYPAKASLCLILLFSAPQ